MSEQEMNLAAILAIVTNPDMVAKNIKKLQLDIENARLALKNVEDKKYEVENLHVKAKETEASALIRHADIDVREDNLKKKEQHWAEKETQQKAAEKIFNEEKLKHADRVRELDQREVVLQKLSSDLNDRQSNIAKIELETKATHEVAQAFKKTYEDKIASIKSFATQVVG